MSYVHCGEQGSAVYILDFVGVGLVCMSCGRTADGKSYKTRSRTAMLNHVAEHREGGDYVPLDVDERLRQEYADIGDTVVVTP